MNLQTVFMLLTAGAAGLVSAFDLQAKTATPSKKTDSTIRVTADFNKKGGFSGLNEEIVFSGEMKDGKEPVKGKYILCNIFKNGKKVESKIISGDAPYRVTTKMDAPGIVLFEALALDENKKAIKRKHPFHNRNLNGGAGILCGMEKMMPSTPLPPDFDKFWENVRTELNQVKMESTLKESPLPEKFRKALVCYDVKVASAGGAPVSGYLIAPRNAKAKSLPAIVSFHGAGVRSAVKDTQYQTKALRFDVNAHGIENGKEKNFYGVLAAKQFPSYQFRNKTDRDKFYFKGMYQRVMRALDYIKSRPEWDGKNLIVMGNSQGGAQALAAAALDPDVSLCVAGVPALGDHFAKKAGRVPGWPKLLRDPPGSPEEALTEKCAPYYDNASFAHRIKCETYIAAGGVDLICVPTSVAVVFNALPAGTRKVFEFFPAKGHDSIPAKGRARISSILNETAELSAGK